MPFPIQAVLEAMQIALPDDNEQTDSVHDYFHRISGTLKNKVITLTASAATQSLNCFQLTGSIEIFKLYGVITTATTLTNCTAAYFNLYDSTDVVALTKNDGVLSGMAVGTLFVKNASAGTTMAVANNVAGALTEPASNKSFYPFIITQKTVADTYIRFTYTTSDTPIAATLTIYCEYSPIGDGTLTEV